MPASSHTTHLQSTMCWCELLGVGAWLPTFIVMLLPQYQSRENLSWGTALSGLRLVSPLSLKRLCDSCLDTSLACWFNLNSTIITLMVPTTGLVLLETRGLSRIRKYNTHAHPPQNVFSPPCNHVSSCICFQKTSQSTTSVPYTMFFFCRDNLSINVSRRVS